MADAGAEEILAAEYLRALHGQVNGALDRVASYDQLLGALGWDGEVFDQVGRRLHEAGLVRLLIGDIGLTVEGKTTVEEA